MRRYELRYLLLWGCMLVLSACGKSDWEENVPVNGGDASLVLTFNSAETKLFTRGIEDLDDNGTVSEEEYYRDGRRMYRLGVFLADSEGQVVASTVLEKADSRFKDNNTSAEVRFDDLEYDRTYTLYAVANYGDYGSLKGYLTAITEDNVTNPDLIRSSSDNLCDGTVVYPLSMKANVAIVKGRNTFAGSLMRTYARLRIGVHNTIDEKLRITGLGFPNNFVQNSTDLFFNAWRTPNVTPVVTSPHAITPFQSDVVVPKVSGTGDAMGTTIFDAYLLESNGGNYQYTLGVKLGEDAEFKIKGNKEQIRDKNNVNGNGRGPYYVIRNTLSEQYLYANAATNTVEVGVSYGTDGAIDPNYVWELERTTNDHNNYNFIIESMGMRGYYMQPSKADNNPNALLLSNEIDYAFVSTHADDLIFTRDGYYLTVSNNRVYWSSEELTGPDTIQQFILYEVEPLNQGTVGSISDIKTFPINIDAIHRNDFINIVVDVSYSRGSRTVSSTCVME